MEFTDSDYNELISKLRTTSPQINKSEELTEKVMGLIQHEKNNYFIRNINWIRPVLSAAAVFLLGLFMFELGNAPTEIQKDSIVFSYTIEPKKTMNKEMLHIENTFENQSVWQAIRVKSKLLSASTKSKERFINRFTKNNINSTLLNN